MIIEILFIINNLMLRLEVIDELKSNMALQFSARRFIDLYYGRFLPQTS